MWFQAINSRPAYSADALAARLNVIPLEGQTVEDVPAAVVAACLEFGVEMRRDDSKKSKVEAGGRFAVVGLACKHAMKNRQKEYREGDAGEVRKTYTLSVRTCVSAFCASLSLLEMIVARERILPVDETRVTHVPWKKPAG